MTIKLWIDDVRPAPPGHVWCQSVNEAKRVIPVIEYAFETVHFKKNNAALAIQLIDIDHDAGDYVSDGGDYIKLLDWLEETGRSYPIRIHSMNPVGVANMRRIIQRNGWREVP